MPTAYSLDLEVPGEVGQRDLAQLFLQSQQPLLGRCRQGKAGVSLATPPPSWKLFIGSHHPQLAHTLPSPSVLGGTESACVSYAMVRPVPVLPKRTERALSTTGPEKVC